MTEPAAKAPRRGWHEWAAIFMLPLVANAFLAVYLATHLGSGLEAIGVPDSPLPEASGAIIVAAVERKTDSDYVCSEPWRVASNISAFSCRTDSVVAVMQDTGSDAVFRLEVTWFGFDESNTDLPHWAAAALGSSPGADDAEQWVAEHVGTHAQTEIDGVTIVVGGARGARTVLLRGE